MADLDLANAEFAVERRPHQLLRDDGLGLGDAGAGLIERGLRIVHRCLRPELAVRQLLGAIQRDLRHALLRLVVGKVALLGSVEQLNQRRTRLHAGARRKANLGDAAVDVRGHVDLMHGSEIADGGQEIRNDFGLGGGDIDVARRRRLAEDLLEQIGQEDELEEPKSAYDGRKQQPDDKKPAHQADRPLVRLVGNRLACKVGFSHDIHVMHFLQLPIVPNSVTARRPDEKQLRPR